jgi:hypothetical protein
MITVTFFADHAARTKDQRDLSFGELFDLIETTTAPSKHELPWLKLAIFGDVQSVHGSFRNDANVRMLTGIEADYDGERMNVDEAIAALERANIAAFVYTSPSHAPDKPRWRVLCPFDHPYPEMRGFHGRMLNWLNGALGGVIGAESWTLSQAYFFGSVNNNPHHRVEYVIGRPITYCVELAELAVDRPGFGGGGIRISGGIGTRRSADYWRAVFAGVPEHGIPELGIAGRDHAAASLAGRLLLEVEREELMPLMREWNANNKPPLPGRDLARIVRSISRRSAR